jgi:hypothetical protein
MTVRLPLLHFAATTAANRTAAPDVLEPSVAARILTTKV